MEEEGTETGARWGVTGTGTDLLPASHTERERGAEIEVTEKNTAP